MHLKEDVGPALGDAPQLLVIVEVTIRIHLLLELRNHLVETAPIERSGSHLREILRLLVDGVQGFQHLVVLVAQLNWNFVGVKSGEY